MTDIYIDWGFTENPFQTTPLSAHKAGKALLVGREVELRKLGMRMHKYPTITCVEGPYAPEGTSCTFLFLQPSKQFGRLVDAQPPIFVGISYISWCAAIVRIEYSQ